jgi:diaminohydroxyphosphoribosylaminopyrimidine deaminase / 5-amino-6-(5-phosphoribosylamino)uracil reductase
MTAAAAWSLLLALARRASTGQPVVVPADGVGRGEVGLRLDADGALVECAPPQAWILTRASAPRGWAWPDGSAAASAEVTALLDLYLPLCVGGTSAELVVGHLAQSLDGRIATLSGMSQFITGDDNLVHAHRMRALCDAVLIGGRTVRSDNPQLTTRRVPGPNAIRVILDPGRRLGADYRVFSDDASPTLLLCTPQAARRSPRHGHAEVVGVETRDDRLSITGILAELRRRGLRRIFVEGGGVTVSRFLQARALTRLQVAVAPMLFGSGRPAFSLPEIENLSEALVLECRHFVMGRDILFDCQFA